MSISSIYAGYLYFTTGEVILFIVILLSIGTVVGVNLGVESVKYCSDRTLKASYSAFLLLASVGIILKQLKLPNVALIYTFALILMITAVILIKYYFDLKIPYARKLSRLVQELFVKLGLGGF